jgi:hypothetical protein
VATVSAVINGKDKVSAELTSRVHQAMEATRLSVKTFRRLQPTLRNGETSNGETDEKIQARIEEGAPTEDRVSVEERAASSRIDS